MQDQTPLDEILKNDPSDLDPPQTTEQWYTESFADVLEKSIGYFVLCEFLIGNSNLVERAGILYAAGMNFVTLYEPENDRYMVCDIYSLKFVTIYNTRTRPRNFRSSEGRMGTGQSRNNGYYR